MLRNLSAVVIGRDLAFIELADRRIGKVLDIIPNRQHDLIGHKPLFNEVEG